MEFYSCFSVIADKKRTMQAIECDEKNPVYDVVSSIYDQLLVKAEQLVNPRAVIRCQAMPENYLCVETLGLEGCKEIIFCIATIGDKVESEIAKLMQDGDYLEALVLNSIADQIVFNITNQVRKIITRSLVEDAVSLTRKFSPGVDQVPMHFQRDIYDRLEAGSLLDLNISPGYMLTPTKSIAFYYGITDKVNDNVLINDHECFCCGDEKCKYHHSSL